MPYSMLEKSEVITEIKGIQEGLIISFNDGEWIKIKEALFNRIEEQENFFNGAKIALDIGDHELHAAEMGSLRDSLSDKKITLWAVISSSLITQHSARMLGIETSLPKTKKETPSSENKQGGENAIYFHKTLRSGVKVCYEGHVVVLGDINPGAEIVAGGSVIVWGRIAGVVHAGAEGDTKAVVCALDLNPTQLRIAGLISISPKRKGKTYPEIARIIDDKVVAESWKKNIGGK